MRDNGKKMFPGKTNSNIFFLDNNNNININPNKYVNKSNKSNDNNSNNNRLYNNKKNLNINKINIPKNNDNLRYNIITNEPITDDRRISKHRSLGAFNSNEIKKSNNIIFRPENQFNKRKVLYTERSVDNIRKRRELGNFSVRDYFKNKKNIWSKRKSNDKLSYSVEYKPLNTISNFNQNNKITDIKNPKRNQKLSSNNYYNKFVNKPPLTHNNSKIKLNKNNKKKEKPSPPKEQTFIIKKIKNDDKLIDIFDLKKSFSKSGINLISISGISNSLVPTKEDKVKIILNPNDINSQDYKNIQRIIRNRGLKLDEEKKNFHIKFTEGIFPEKTKWNDITYGGREKFEKLKINEKFDKERKEKKFYKKQLISKNNYYNYKYKNNLEIKPKRYKSVEK